MHRHVLSLRARRSSPLVAAAMFVCLSGQGCPSAASVTGPQGEAGPPGASGLACWDLNGNGTGDTAEDVNGDGVFDTRDCQPASRVYGDGSAGTITITNDTFWTAGAGSPPPGYNTQFTDFTVNAGATLIIPSGVVIRCTGTFTNNGTIQVSVGAVGAMVDLDASSNPNDIHGTNYRQPSLGISLCAPSSGEYATPDGAPPESGFGGCGISEPLIAAFVLSPGVGGGGGGAAAYNGLVTGFGGDGGGTLVVRAQGAIVNTGVIRADGDAGQQFGCGGGGGGVVILASQKWITSNAAGALISAHGGNGGESNASRGPGGGGGGGIVHLIAPSIVVETVDVAGGFGGNVVGQITSSLHQAGAGGGGSYGYGGDGGNGATVVPGTPGGALTSGAGILLQTLVDPGTLF